MGDTQDKQVLTWQGPTKCLCPVCHNVFMIQWPVNPISGMLDVQCIKCNMTSAYHIVIIEALAAAVAPPRAAWPTHTVEESST